MASFFDAETELIFNLLTKEKIEKSLVKKCRWGRFLRLASVNRVLYFVCERIRGEKGIDVPPAAKNNIDTVFLQGREEIGRAAQTLKLLTNVFEKAGLDFLVVKTIKEFPYVFNDIDILVRAEEYKKACKVLGKQGGVVRPYEPKRQADICLEGYTNVDLHRGFHWQNSEYLDLDFVWRKPQKRRYQGVEFPVPSDSVRWALVVLNILFERYYISFSDFFFLKRGLVKIDAQKVISQAKKYNWDEALGGFLEILGGLEGHERFPYILPSRYMLGVFWEGLRRKYSIKLFQMAYYTFAKIRFHLTKGRKVPVYGDWFNFERLRW